MRNRCTVMEPQPRPDVERRHPRLSYDELRRQLIDADEDRYRLQTELASAIAAPHGAGSRWSKIRWRIAFGAGVVVVTGLAGGLVWQMCPPAWRANDRSAVRLDTVKVTPRMIEEEAPPALPVATKVASKSPIKRPAKSAAAAQSRTTPQIRKARVPPRPLSPGEFGRPRIAAY
jgi:hypothetical protein